MQVTETNAEGLKREYTIVVPAGDLDDSISRRLGEIGRTVRLPGFRPGKVPLQILRKRFGAAVRGEVLESTVQDGSAQAIRDHNLRPAMPPRVELVSASEGADLEYKMSVEVLPDMPEADFSGLALERLVADVPDENVDTAVQRLADQQRKATAVERPAATGDVVLIDIVGRIDGEEFPGSRGEGRELELGSGTFIPGFEDQLIGAGAGEKRTVTVTFPADYGSADLAGKEAIFDVDVKEVRERQPAAIDDALAEAVGLENLGELRDEIRQRMKRDLDELARQRLKGALLDKLAERFDFPVPPGMLEMEFDSIWRQYEEEKRRRDETSPAAASLPIAAESGAGNATQEGAAAEAPAIASVTTEPMAADGAADAPVSPDEVAPDAASSDGASDLSAVDESDEEARAEYRRIAERRVRLGLLLAEVGRNNNITVTQEELNQALTREARRHPGYERQVLDYYRKNPDTLGNLRAPIFEDKVVDFILELAKVDERKVTPQELMAYPELGEGAESMSEPAAQRLDTQTLPRRDSAGQETD